MKNLDREDRRVVQRRADCDAARRRLLPVMVAACEVYGVTPDDVLSSSHHPHVVAARNVVTYLGWERCKIGTGVLADVLKKSRPETSKKLTRLRAEADRGVRTSFGRQVGFVLRKMGVVG
jgi:hypothetical protein